jgi:hypothetical protein
MSSQALRVMRYGVENVEAESATCKKIAKLAQYNSGFDVGRSAEVATNSHFLYNRKRVQCWSMSLIERVQKDMVDAMKTKAEGRLSALRMMKAALKKQEIDSMKPLDEAAEMQVMNTLLKQRREAADLFRKGGREELASKEEAEAAILESYLPSAPSTAELEEAVTLAISETGASSAKQMGAVMKAAQARLAGKRIDGKALSELVKQRLG